MVKTWRWDQGRLSYFKFENLRILAKSLLLLEGTRINTGTTDPLRHQLELDTGLPFSPAHYKVWRNYKRVFECSLLATSINNQLFVTDFCRKLASKNGGSFGDVDEYLSSLIPRFAYPFPAFNDYQSVVTPSFPFCSVLRFLLSRFFNQAKNHLALEEVFSYLIGNNCSGTEDDKFYLSLQPTGRIPVGDEKRQVREMLIFLSQLSTLKWYNGKLFLDIDDSDFECIEGLRKIATPIVRKRKSDPGEELISLSTLADKDIPKIVLPSREIPADDFFVEGKRTRVTHLRIERSPLLRKLFLHHHSDTICDMCICNTKDRYPWTENLLEIHHILPLSCAISITGAGTSLEDLVGLCPTCHRSIHIFYRTWLKNNSVEDFSTKDEAREVYDEAKATVII